MNFIDRFLLWFFLLPEGIYKKAGINMDQLKAILTAKLTIDNRRPNSFGGNNRRKSEKKEVSKATITTMLGSLLVGLFLLFSFMAGVDITTKMSLFTTMFIFMLCVTLITDFTSVLIDIRDNLIILPKPISDRTFLIARLMHILIRICIVVLPISLPSLIFVTITEGIQMFFPFILIVALMTLLSIFIINAIYILILKVSTPVKFQNVIGSIQVGFTVFLMAGYQLMPRLIESSTLSNTSLSTIPYIRFYPPFWFAEASLALAGKGMSPEAMISVVLSVLVPFISIWLVIRYFAPSFSRKLSMISAGSAEQSVSVKSKKANLTKTSLIEKIAKLLTKAGAEYAGFIFTAKMIGRSRDFKMRVYPSMGYLLVFGGIMFFKNDIHTGIMTSGKQIMPSLLMIIYISSMFLTTAILQLQTSDKYKASWIFFITPVKTPGEIISGAIKCILAFYFLPIVILIMSLGLVLQGPFALPNLLLGAVNVMSIAILISFIMVKKLPFSYLQEGTSGGSTFIRSMIMLIIPGVFGLVHWLISGYYWVVILLLLLSSVVPWLLLDEIKKQKWEKLYPKDLN